MVRVHSATGACARDAATPDRVAESGDAERRDLGQLPVPAAVRRAPRRGRDPEVPHLARPQADGGVVEPVGGWGDRRAVHVPPGTAAHRDHLDLPERRLVSRLGFGGAVPTHRARRPGTRSPGQSGSDDSARLEPAGTDPGTAMSQAPDVKAPETPGADAAGRVRVTRWIATVA